MARDKSNDSPADHQDGLPTNTQADAAPADATPANTATTPATVTEPTSDERYVFINVDDGKGGKVPAKRKDIIISLWTGVVTTYNPEGKKFSRGAIAKLLTEWAGKKVAYQIVFQATSKIEGGPPKEVAAAAPTTTETPPAA